MSEKFSLLRDLDSSKSGIDARFKSMETEIAQLKSALAQKSTGHSVNFNIQAEIEEALEKDKKRLSVVLVGMPETDKNVLRSESDKDVVLGIAKKLNLDEESITDIFRDGKLRETTDPARPYSRIMKVKFAHKEGKSAFCVVSNQKLMSALVRMLAMT